MGAAAEPEVEVTAEAILPVWVDPRHLPSICASIDKTNTQTKVYCMYRLACLCKTFLKTLCSDAPLHEALHVLGARTSSQVEIEATSRAGWMERKSNTSLLWRYVFGPRCQDVTVPQGWENDFEVFRASSGEVQHCAFVADRRFQISATTYISMVESAGPKVATILEDVDTTARQRRDGHLQNPPFFQRMQQASQGLLSIYHTQYRIGPYDVRNTVDLMKDYYMQHIKKRNDWFSPDDKQRLSTLSAIEGVLVDRGAGGDIQEKRTRLCESFVVNGWYLHVRVTQYHPEGEEVTEVLPDDTSEKDRIVYIVNMEIPIIKVHICNLERQAIEDCDRQLLITNTDYSDEELITRERTGVTLMFSPEDKLEINCDISELYSRLPEETGTAVKTALKNAVLRIVLRPT